MDKRKKRVLIVLCVGSVVLIWRIYAICAKYLPSSANAQPTPAVVEPVPASITAPTPMPVRAATPSPQDLNRRLTLQDQVAERPWGRDPFEAIEPVATGPRLAPTPNKAQEKPPETPDVKIVGVSARNGVWIAIINGTVYHVGDALPIGCEVRRITRDAVTLESRGWAFIFTLGASEPTIARIDGGNE